MHRRRPGGRWRAFLCAAFWTRASSYFERSAPDGTGPAVAVNLAASVTIQPGLSPVSPAFSKSFGDMRSLTPQGFSADSGVYLQISNSFCSERTGVAPLRRLRSQTGHGSPGFEGRLSRVFEGGVRDAPRSGIVAPAASIGVAGKRGTLRLEQTRGGSHPRLFSTDGKHRGAHNKEPNQSAALWQAQSALLVGGVRQGGHAMRVQRKRYAVGLPVSSGSRAELSNNYLATFVDLSVDEIGP